ncbi:MAG: hypothetical protein WD470_04030 [Rhodospirillaceae bacterium]
MPPAIALISYAADGVSYAASGKGVADHSLSAATDRDCAILRIAGGKAVCRSEPVSADAAAPALAMIAVREEEPGRDSGAQGSAPGKVAAFHRGPAWAISASAGVVGQERLRPEPAGDGDPIAAEAFVRTPPGA